MTLSLPWVLGWTAMLAYAAAAWPTSGRPRWPDLALVIGWLAHGATLAADISGHGATTAGARFGFAPALSATVWIVIVVHAIESRLLPLPTVRLLLAVAASLAVLLAALYPGTSRPSLSSPWLPVHWLLGVVSYGLFAVAVLHAILLDGAERRLRATPGRSARPGALPLLQLERLTFRFVETGFLVLSCALLMGIVLAEQWRWDHKTVLSLLGWTTFAVLIGGRHLRGWRGRQATRWVYAGALLLLLAYVGARFVLEVLLRRGGLG